MVLDAVNNAAAPRGKGRIPLTIGFANLGGEALEPQRQADVRALWPLFDHVAVPDVGKVPTAAVLMVYAKLQADGTLAGMPHPVGIRQLVQATGAGIVVLASDNDPEAVKAAIALPGPKTANIVFTLARKDRLLNRFLVNLFSDMARGEEMLMAWVKIVPQGPASARDDLPATILAAEGGKLAFPRIV